MSEVANNEYHTPDEIERLEKIHDLEAKLSQVRAERDDWMATAEMAQNASAQAAIIEALTAERKELLEFKECFLGSLQEALEVEQLRELQHKREGEAIQRWREEDPGRELSMPDYGRLLDWLKDKLEQAEAREKRLAEVLEEIIDMHPDLPSPRALRALLAEIEGERR